MAAKWKKCFTLPVSVRSWAGVRPHRGLVMSPCTTVTRFMSQPAFFAMASNFFCESLRTST